MAARAGAPGERFLPSDGANMNAGAAPPASNCCGRCWQQVKTPMGLRITGIVLAVICVAALIVCTAYQEREDVFLPFAVVSGVSCFSGICTCANSIDLEEDAEEPPNPV